METIPEPQSEQKSQNRAEADQSLAQAYQAAADFMKELELDS